ncbi:hypothetical protein [Pseudoalteromonas ruthenica]|uniref:hypothetical protein n=1 Tax=Pseudoalteromonas ruthenica TaxID=151081 RepID=UPI00110A242C|nr:hypothetical protein [Pseudoalteromonas ruthenica]
MILEESDYATLLATITSISGLFIGLYYTALTSVGSAIYARVPQSLRALLLKEKKGDAYLRYLVALTFFGVLLLSSWVLGYRANPLTAPLLALGGGIAVIAFYQLGARLFSLFEPTKLADEVIGQMKSSIENLQPNKPSWLTPRFQLHERKRNLYHIETLEALSDIAKSEPHMNGKVFINFTNKIMAFLCWYERQKSVMPKNSEWFSPKYNHPEWYKTSDTETSIRYGTSMPLQPEVIRDHRWLERRLFNILLSCLESNLNSPDFQLALQALGCINRYSVQIAKTGEFYWLLEVLDGTSLVCEKFINASLSRDQHEQPINHVALCDAVSAIPINCMLSYFKVLSSRTGDNLKAQVNEITWSKPETIYKNNWPNKALTRLEWLLPRMQFETGIEKKAITPKWYILNEVAREEANSLAEAMPFVTHDFGSKYKVWIDKLVTSRRYWLAATCIVRAREFWNKLDYHLEDLDVYLSSLLQYRKHDKTWPNIGLSELHEDIKKNNEIVNEYCLKCLPELSKVNRPNELPDFAGYFLHHLGEVLFKAFMNNDYSTVRKVYGSYFNESFVMFKKLMPNEVQDEWHLTQNLKVAATPLLDLLDLTGYGLILGHFYGNSDLSKFISLMWRLYFSDQHQIQKVDQLMATIKLLKGGFEIPHRSQYRFNWKQGVTNKLSKSVPKDNFNPSRELMGGREIRLHDDPLVRLFSSSRTGTYYDGVNVFVFYTLADKNIKSVQEFYQSGWSLKQDIEKEEEHYAKYKSWKEKTDA